MARLIGFVTVARSDWSYHLPMILEMKDRGEDLPVVYATGNATRRDMPQLQRDARYYGLRVFWVPNYQADDTPEAIACAIGATIKVMASAFSATSPDMVVLLGDRFEQMGAAYAAHFRRIPIAHMAAGHTTLGAIDETCRNVIQCFAALHFTPHQPAAEKVRRMTRYDYYRVIGGRDPVTVADHLQTLPLDDVTLYGWA